MLPCPFATLSFMTIKYENDLILLGMGATRRLCPLDNTDIPIWSCNTGYIQIAEMSGYLSKIFMTHPQHMAEDGITERYSFKQMNMLVRHGIEILNIHRCKGLNHKMYPLKRIIKKFDTDYFSDTIGYMFAYALDMWTDKIDGRLVLKEPEKKHRIRTFGIDMATFDSQGHSGEYQLEKGGVEFWVGYAKGLNVRVEIGDGSFVCETITGHPYGTKFWNWEDLDPFNLLDHSKYEGLVF